MIHVEGLTKYYDNFCAVDQISFDIQKGEIIGLLGPNGAGKTTTLRMLTGFFQPTAGSIQVKDFNMNDNSLEIKKLIGYLPESAPLYHDMLAYDYLDYIARIRGLDKNQKQSRIRYLSDLCGLQDVMHKTIGELSKGLKQRVGLAHAMMSDPEILILDEPTSGLDPNQIIEIREIIRRIGQEKTIILSTHILSEAEATCNRIIIIHQGKIVADGSTADLKQAASGERVVNVSLLKADVDSAIAQFGSVEGIARIEHAGNGEQLNLQIISDSLSNDIRPGIYAVIKQNDWILLEFRQETKTLEHIFRELTKEN